MIELIGLLFIVAVLLLLIGIFVRSGRGRRRPRGLGVRPCPYCRERCTVGRRSAPPAGAS